VCAGQLLLGAGDPVTPARIGLLASQGIAEVPVFWRPLVNVVSTGDELVEPGLPLAPGELYNSNGPMLKAAAERAGAAASTAWAADDPDALCEVLTRSLESGDFTVIAGGVSVGERDYVKEVLNGLGVVTDFWRVRVKPGKPFLFGRHTGGALVFGLPGNPVSAYVTFALFVLPAIRKSLGYRVDPARGGLGEFRGVAAEEMSNAGDRPHYLRGVVSPDGVKLSGTQQSHAIFGLSRADCLVRLEVEQSVHAGEPVTGLLL